MSCFEFISPHGNNNSQVVMKKISILVYPFLFAVYPILTLIVHNIVYIDPGAVVRSLLLALALAVGLWLVFQLVARDWTRVGIMTVWALILFFSYGHVYLQLEKLLGEAVRHRYLAGAFVVLLVFGTWWIAIRLKDVGTWQKSLVTVGCVLTGFSLIQLAGFEFSHYQTSPEPVSASGGVSQSGQRPDIYWILLDAHTRSDILLKDYNYDNSTFIHGLGNLGFYVAQCAQSNYPSTQFSVSSLMYGQYLQDIPGFENGLPPLKNGMVSQTVRSLGYTVIAFENRSNGHFDLGEDMRLSRHELALGKIDLLGGLNEFEFTLMQTSALRLIYDMPQLIPGLAPEVLSQSEYSEHYRQTLFILDALPNLPETSGPKFVFTHILVPHPPYIFTPDGKFQFADNQVDGYRSNVEFIDTQILETVRQILESSDIPPIIVIQGDHGPAGSQVTPEMRMSILNAYYVNDQTKRDLYPTVTPINTFRIIFNNYFKTNYPLLEDKSYFAYLDSQITADNIIPNNCFAP